MAQQNYATRQWWILTIFVSVPLLYCVRLFFLQVVDNKWNRIAEENAIRIVTEVPPRGLIFDRHGEKMVDNVIAYDLVVVPRNVKSFDTIELCNILGITPQEVVKKLEKAAIYNPFLPSPFIHAMSDTTHARIAEKLYKFKGFYDIPRTTRYYHTTAAAHTLGYIREVNQEDLQEDKYYVRGDYIGKSGIERSYETLLRGQKGKRMILKDNLGREQGSYKDGQYDTMAVAGHNLWASIDKSLQEYCEMLMQGKRGSIVAIEPSSGEILALVTAPSYAPAMLEGQMRDKNFLDLLYDTINKPLLNRALTASYPPGSTFKLANALVTQQAGIVDETTRYSCSYGFSYGNRKLGCHGHASPLDITGSVQNSCNAWYCRAFKAMLENRKLYPNTATAYADWRRRIMLLGFGHKFDSDLPYQRKGLVPDTSYYNRFYGKNRWQATSIISVSIGQGEISATPVQLANLAALIANRGYYYPPHLIRAIDNIDSLNPRFVTKKYTGIAQQYFQPVILGMERAVTAGTARRAGVPGIRVAAKTGTAENPHGADHSLLVCFAPVENPKIAISVIVENGGFGATWAAPIASLIIEKYINGEVKRKELEQQISSGVIRYTK
ncbi:MAG: penicillin-binding protein 2 [Bacteroidales bacterium]|jgi:penicillin-binding protein 2|nr:penicillin-binding protein 2 [Bacteroidales bacterium]